jgi:L-threonylcarbamoyladenylate synthase
MSWNDENLVKILKQGSVVVMPTDTLYGIVGSALNKGTVERIYELRKRNSEKPCIILISGIEELQKFSITLTSEQKMELEKMWSPDSEPTSVVLDCPDEKFTYLHRGTNTLAFRVPASNELRNLLHNSGPLIAPSANIEGQNPSKNIKAASAYFGEKVDLYVDGGGVEGKASRVIKLHKDGSISILRE